MRRFALSAAAVCGLALLTACGSGGGYGFSSGGNGSIESVAFTSGLSGQANNFFVAPGGVAPLEVDAIAQKGSGPTALVVPDATFTWGARFVDPAVDGDLATYQTGPVPNAPKRCGAPSQTPAIPIYKQNTASVVGPYAGYSALPAGQASKTVFIGSVPGVTPATSGNASYCIVLVATHVGDGVQGSKVIVVSNSP